MKLINNNKLLLFINNFSLILHKIIEEQMKKELFLKDTVSILLYVHYILIIGLLIYLIYGISQNPTLWLDDWTYTTFSIITYFGFAFLIYQLMKGLHYLRKICFLLLNGDYFSDDFINKLQLSGKSFTIFGILLILFSIISWFIRLFGGYFEITYSFTLVMPVFTLIIGLFFSILAKALKEAQGFKSENELTI